MKLLDIYKYLDRISPFETQESWDNSGLILGSFDDEITDIVISLEIDEHVISEATFGSLIVTHHPLIFSKLNQIKSDTYPSKFIVEAIKKNIKIIAMHTNYDKSHLNDFVLEKVLGFEKADKSNEDDFASFYPNMTTKKFLEFLKDKLNLELIKHTFSNEELNNSEDVISKASLVTGAGASYLQKVASKKNIQVFLTGDIKYHEAMEAKALNLNLIDIGHFESEIFFSQSIEHFLKNLELNIKITDSKNPFKYFK